MAGRIAYRTIEGRSRGYLALLGGLCALVLLGLGSAWVMEHNGHYITGMNNQIVWGMPHVFT
jgi:molybdopterin-containing oxidoreductase family membrane subunit